MKLPGIVDTAEYGYAAVLPGQLTSWRAGQPAGAVNGTNTTFILPDIVEGNPTLVFWVNYPLVPGVGYTVNGNQVICALAPAVGAAVYYTYLYPTAPLEA